MRLPSIFLLCLLTALAGCASSRARLQEIQYAGRPAVRLSNGTAELVVVPSLGRITRYGYVGGRNVLWENLNAPAMAGKSSGWQNWGGDKVWPWPQSGWAAQTGKEWPPPSDRPYLPYEIEWRADRLVMTSTPVDGYGVRIVREIRLEPTGTAVHIQNRFEPTAPRAATTSPADAARPWTVTQIPAPTSIRARLVPDTTGDGVTQMGGTMRTRRERVGDGDVVTIERPEKSSAKVGLEADCLIATYDDLEFTQTATVSSKATFAPGERAQVYAEPDRPQPQALTPYVELEFIAPVGSDRIDLMWQLAPVAGPK